MRYIVRLDSSRVATLVKVRSATLVSSSDPTRVKSNYIPVETTILRQIERCHGVNFKLSYVDNKYDIAGIILCFSLDTTHIICH